MRRCDVMDAKKNIYIIGNIQLPKRWKWRRWSNRRFLDWKHQDLPWTKLLPATSSKAEINVISSLFCVSCVSVLQLHYSFVALLVFLKFCSVISPVYVPILTSRAFPTCHIFVLWGLVFVCVVFVFLFVFPYIWLHRLINLHYYTVIVGEEADLQ